MVDREAQLRESLARTPDDAESLRELASLVGRARSRKDEAARLWARYVELADNEAAPDPLMQLARALIEARRDEAAVDALVRCSTLHPNEAAVFDLLGEVLRYSGRLEEAVPALERACRLDPESIRPRLALASCLDALGREGEAARILEEVQAQASSDPAVTALVRELRHRRG